MNLVPVDSKEAEKLDTSVEPQIGQWYWLNVVDRDSTVLRVLTCITHVGSNYVEVTGPTTRDNYYEDGTSSWRIHLDGFYDELTFEPDPISHIEGRIEHHKANARELLNEIKQLTAGLGLSNARLGGAEESATALSVAASTDNIQAHKAALIKAKDKTLPELFKQVKEQHSWLAKWMKARVIPERARLDEQKQLVKQIDGRIFTVELYAGLIEQLEQVVDGQPASIDDKLHLFQRRHYMDEECLANYRAGGLKFKNMSVFDAWLAEPDNFHRVLPKPRSVVAFQVRRDPRKYDEDWQQADISDFISFNLESQADKLTFLYIRNGEQLWRLSTSIDFGPQLFPDQEHNELLMGGQLYWYRSEVKTQREFDAQLEDHIERRGELAAELKVWKKAPKKTRGPQPWSHSIPDDPRKSWEKLDRSSVYHDDGMEQIATMIREHNQIATVLQGLLDRSTCMHPHPPWRLWTPEGFLAGVALVYDDSRALVEGDAPDFADYRNRLNSSLKRGDLTVGQEDAWELHEGEKEAARMDRSYRTRGHWRPKRHRPYGNPGPGLIAKVEKLGRDGSATFEWSRERQGHSWQDHPTKKGYLQYRRDPKGDISSRFRCPVAKLLNVSAYKAGDFKIFYNDPRTRMRYLQWAPLLLAAEDYVNGKTTGENFKEPKPEETDDDNDE